MGCERHPVEPEIRFLDGHVEPFIQRPLTRWQRRKWDFFVAAGLALVFGVILAICPIVELFRAVIGR